jgi:hypothetical protein
MNEKTKAIAAGAAIVLVLGVATSLWMQSSSRKRAKAAQSFYPLSPAGPFVPDVNAAGANQMAAYKLMSQYGVDIGRAIYLAQAKAKVLRQSNTSVHYLLTLPDGISSDETITITPDVRYTPTQAELETAVKTGRHIYNVKFTAKNESDTKAHLTLQYFVLYSAVPPELQRRIHTQTSSLHWFDLVPSAWAQESGGEGLGAGVYQDTAIEVAKEFLKQQAEHGELSKEFPTPLARLVDTLNALKKEQEHLDWMNELSELRECVENPSNPLTRKAFDQDPAYKEQALNGLNDARSDVMSMTAMRFLNLATSVATDLVEGPLGAITSPVSSLNDETLKELAERRITDAKKEIVPCENKPIIPGDFKPVQVSITYEYNRTFSAPPGYQGQRVIKKKAQGQFSLNPILGGGLEGTGPVALSWKERVHTEGMGHLIDDGELEVTGNLRVEAQGGGDSTNGSIHLSFETDEGALTANEICNVCGPGGQHRVTHTRSISLSCTVGHLDLVHGGSGSAFTDQDDGYGTCTIEVSRK